MTELKVDRLSKSYARRAVLTNISFSISPGEVVGFVGPNGAGKSTTMKIMLGLVHADKGDVCVDGASLSENRQGYLQRVAGFVDGPPQYPILSAREHLEYVARMRGIDLVPNVDTVLSRVGLSAESRKPVSRFSMGMKQRVAIAMALLQMPKFLVLDEPANGLDPAALAEFRQLIVSLANDGVGVLISSHILSEIERICDRVVFIRAGKVFKHVRVKLDEQQTILSLRTTDDESAAVVLQRHPGVEHVEMRGERIFVSVAQDRAAEIATSLVSSGIGLFELSPAKDSLESDYLNEFRDKEILS